MRNDDIERFFRNAHPRAVDVSENEYIAQKAEFTDLAERSGYRLSGFREGRAVFTTKPEK